MLVALAARPATSLAAEVGQRVLLRLPNGQQRELTLERVLGAGYWARTYEARDVATQERVAIKIMRGRWRGHGDSFDKELQVVRAAGDPRLPVIHGVGRTVADEPERALVMEFLEGQTVATGQPFPLGKAVRITMQVLRGVRALHRAGYRHNDVQPNNVMLKDDRSDSTRLIDPGNAMRLEEDFKGGLPGYIPPEPRHGSNARMRGPAGDIYACGALLRYLLTGEHPNDENWRALPDAGGVRGQHGATLSEVVRRAMAPRSWQGFHLASRRRQGNRRRVDLHPARARQERKPARRERAGLEVEQGRSVPSSMAR